MGVISGNLAKKGKGDKGLISGGIVLNKRLIVANGHVFDYGFRPSSYRMKSHYLMFSCWKGVEEM
jgi:hypothetical protein